MPKRRSQAGTGNAPSAADAKRPAQAGGATERPPESAENFEHVLRRLISGKAGRTKPEENARRNR